MTDRVLVTGGSGFVAGYLIRRLVADGWLVHATVRDLAREDGARKRLKVDDSSLKFFAANLASDAGWSEAMDGCTHVAHLASPFLEGAIKEPSEVIVLAREGALRVLRAAKAGGVRRFVMTSSVVATCYGRAQGTRPFTEADWADLSRPDVEPYYASKAIAERAARDWVASEDGGVEFCTVNPSLMLGPVLGDDFSPSIKVVKMLLEGALPACPDLGWEIVDVRDVVDLQVRVLNAPNMAGERFIASGPFLKMIDIARVLKRHLGTEAKSVPTRRLPDLLFRLKGLFDPATRQLAVGLGRVRRTDSSHAKAVFGWTSRPAEQSIVDTSRSLLDFGIVRV
jgi:dihydroflavonol-4-reductase